MVCGETPAASKADGARDARGEILGFDRWGEYGHGDVGDSDGKAVSYRSLVRLGRREGGMDLVESTSLSCGQSR